MSRAWEGVHSCHAECPCQTGGEPTPDFLSAKEAPLVEPLWARLCNFAARKGLSYGIGLEQISGNIVAYVGDAMGHGRTSNEAINRCADSLTVAHGWQDDRNSPAPPRKEQG